MIRVWLTILIVSLFSAVSFSAPTCYTSGGGACAPGTFNCYQCVAETCSSAHVNAAIVATQAGGTITIPSGDCTLTNQWGNYTSTAIVGGDNLRRIDLNKPVKLIGQGTNCPASAYSTNKGTCLTMDFRSSKYSPATPLIYYRPSSSYSQVFEFGNMQLDTGYSSYTGTDGSNCIYASAFFDGSGTYLQKLRVHHSNFLNGYRPFYYDRCNTGGWPSFNTNEGKMMVVRYMTGVVDHNYITGSSFGNHGRWGGAWAATHLNPWTQGTDAALFYENNYWKKTLQSSIMQFSISDQGGSSVWRYNTFDYTDPGFTGTYFYPVDVHGHQAGPTQSGFGGEFYGNYVITRTGQSFDFIDHRGSRLKMFNNVSSRAGAGSVSIGNLWDDLAEMYGTTSSTGYWATNDYSSDPNDGFGLCLNDGVTLHPGHYVCSNDADRRPQHVNQTYVWNNRDIDNKFIPIKRHAGPTNYTHPSEDGGLDITGWGEPTFPIRNTHLWIDYKNWSESSLVYSSDTKITCIWHGYGTSSPDAGWESCPSTGLPRTSEQIQGDKTRYYKFTQPTSGFDITLGSTQTHGIACGTAAQRLAISSPTAGVGFWEVSNTTECNAVLAYGHTVSASNKIQGTLYRATGNAAPNQWAVFYTPYTYPHPLTLGDVEPVDSTNPSISDESLQPSGVQECSGEQGTYTLYALVTDNVAVAGVKSCPAGESCTASTSYNNMTQTWANVSGNLWSFEVTVPCNTLNKTYYLMAVDTSVNYSTVKAIVFSTQTEEDTIAPTITNVEIDANGLWVEITFSEPVRIGAGGAGGFVLVDDDSNEYVLTYSGPGNDSTKLRFNSASCIPSGADDFAGVGGLLYAHPTDGIEDMHGNDLASIESTIDTANGSGTVCSVYSGFASIFSHDDPITKTGGTWMRSDGIGGNVGTVFTSSIGGTITQLCFYKDEYLAVDEGTRTGSLWLVSPATMLASVDFEETESGWQCQNLSTPVNINAGTQYAVAMHLITRFIYVSYAFSNEYISDFVDGTLTVPVSGGRYSTESPLVLPAGLSTRNYGVDIVMVYGTEPEEGPWTVALSKTGDGCVFQESSANLTTDHRSTAEANIALKPGWQVSWGGTCGGSATGNKYTTNSVTADCTVTATCTSRKLPFWLKQ